jgi:GMP synthase-like glutamine amidotransferase
MNVTKPITLLQHEAEIPAGSILDTLDALGVYYEVRRLYAGDPVPHWPQDTAGVIALGGRIEAKETNAHPWLHDEINLLRRIVQEGGPVWGIGLGAELLTLASGGEVYQRRLPELGWVTIDKIVDDPLLHGVSSPFVAFCWNTHSCKPSSTSHMTAEHEGEMQSFRAGGRAWATQFHPELTAELAVAWIDSGVKRHRDLEPAFVEKLRQETAERLVHYPEFCRTLTVNFLAASGLLPQV